MPELLSQLRVFQMHFRKKRRAVLRKKQAKLCMWAGSGSGERGRGRSNRRTLLYKERLLYAAHRGCGSARVVQVAYLIFIRSLLDYSVSFPLPPRSSLSFSHTLLRFSCLRCFFGNFRLTKPQNFLIHTYCCCPQRQRKKRKKLLPAGCLNCACVSVARRLPAPFLHTPPCFVVSHGVCVMRCALHGLRCRQSSPTSRCNYALNSLNEHFERNSAASNDRQRRRSRCKQSV